VNQRSHLWETYSGISKRACAITQRQEENRKEDYKKTGKTGQKHCAKQRYIAEVGREKGVDAEARGRALGTDQSGLLVHRLKQGFGKPLKATREAGKARESKEVERTTGGGRGQGMSSRIVGTVFRARRARLF